MDETMVPRPSRLGMISEGERRRQAQMSQHQSAEIARAATNAANANSTAQWLRTKYIEQEQTISRQQQMIQQLDARLMRLEGDDRGGANDELDE
jgi:hypothetical protein